MLYGVDVHARYQGGLDIPLLARQGYSFVVSKASEGLSVPSTSSLSSAAFKARTLMWMDQTRQEGMIPGLYHWIKSGNGAAQAAFFHGIVREAGGPAGMLIQLDCEDNATYQDLVNWRDEWNRLTSGHPFPLYTGGWWWRPRGWNGYAITPYLWDSHYLTADADTIPDNPAQYQIPPSWWFPGYGGWPSATILQFTSRGDAGSMGNNIDLNAFRGTRDDLLALTGSPIGEKDMFLLKVTGNDSIYISDGINTRPMPGGTWPTTGEPLRKAGVPLLEYPSLPELLKGGGPLVSETGLSEEQMNQLADKVAARVLGPVSQAAKASSDVLAAETPTP